MAYPGMLINCATCRTPLVLPPGVASIRCALCHGVTHVSSPSSSSSPSPSNSGASKPGPPQHSPAPLNSHGSKRALIVGVSYKFSRYELKGCLNDAKCMKFMLTKNFHFPEASILILTEEQVNPVMKPTRHNIRMAMVWLVQGCQKGDSLVFHYSGHGSRQRNYTGDEVDGYDETILPVDFETQGMIVDDEINATLVRPLPHGVRLHAIVDSCHSGTVLDLPFLCRMNSQGQAVWEDHRPRNGAWKGTNGGDAYCFSGCDDDQTSADTSALSQVTYTGAMTFCFIQAIERGQARTYRDLLHSMRYGVRSVRPGGSGDSVGSLVQMLFSGGSYTPNHIQEPQLTAATMFDINMPFHI